uniref:GOLD domain-containing protein n=1 Tax=Lotus japonicus TaxID=34305 RepID=I3S1Y6_LOTJA|nr:unknown [Lotus japonicus]
MMSDSHMLVSLLFFLGFFSTCHAVWFVLPPSGTKCVSEQIQSNVVVLAHYVAIGPDYNITLNPTVSVKVTSPYGKDLHHSENATYGDFAFTTQEAGSYLACFSLENNQGTGIAAKDWDEVAKKEKIEGVELELRKLEGSVTAILENLKYLKGREAEMRSVSEKTNTRVATFSIMSLGICIVVSALQLWRLKRYFQKKKLI